MPNVAPTSLAARPGNDSPVGNQLASFRSSGRWRSLSQFRAANPFPLNSQILIDKAVVRVGRQNLVVANDLLSTPGLQYGLPNWMGVPSLYREAISESGTARVTMVPKARGERHQGDRSGFFLPIPMIWDDFSFNIREQEMSDRVGAGIDTINVEQATRNVNEMVEDLTINGYKDANGVALTFAGNRIYGLLDTNNAYVYPSGLAWDDPTKTGKMIVADIQAMVSVLVGKQFYGPYTLYVPTSYGIKFNEFYTDGTTTQPITIGAHLATLKYAGTTLTIVVADKLPANRTILVQKTNNVVDMVVGSSPYTITWTDGPGFERYYVVVACIIPRFFPNYLGYRGVVAGGTS